MIDLASPFLKALLKHSTSPIIIFKVKPILVVVEHNDAYLALIERVGGKSKLYNIDIIPNLLSDAEKNILIKTVEKVSELKAKSTLIIHPIYSNSPNVKWELEFSPVLQNDRPVEYLVCSLREIPMDENDLEHILFELSESEARFRGFFEQAPLGMCVLKGPELITEYANDNILKIWGKSRKEVIGLPLEEARSEFEKQQALVKRVKDIFKNEQPLTLNELKLSTAVSDGYFIALYEPLKNDKNEVTRILVIIKDITEQVNFKKELLKAKDILKIAMDASEMGSWNIDLENKQILLSERAQHIYELENNRLGIEEAKSLISPEDSRHLTSGIKRALHHRNAFNIEYQINLNGISAKRKWLRTAGKAYYNEEGKAVYIAGAVLDITEHKQDEIRKNDFIGMVSHELKTPLTSLSAYVQLLQFKFKETDNEFPTQILDKINVQLKRMSLMIDGFLNVSLLESGKILLNKTNFNLVDLIKTIAEENRMVLPSHFIQVIGPEEMMLHADMDKIGNVVNNLIGNAAKYSKKESLIAIKCDIQKGYLVISVEDEGIGIKEDNIPKLFDRFYRVESSDTKTIAGFGVGLYICSEVIQRHGGKIWAESKLGQGSTFYFSLPIPNDHLMP
ncbi:PAS domain S-box protein [Pedobacter sp. MR2016-19]|uniref:PAS domain-containing sensor histidine kinase n=1 Tax=Pedobacter sp. MR2016-19 TaxID=2780089 RepID=UPI0018767961|nr:ATP-binding protein [Pedobacter sp. MR2016-19]MBE5322074.1 PAS domain S-box protein [Pedobacter sp. MR2016-19]